MGNRFGRNQRRRMREQVAALEDNLSNMQQAYEMTDGLQKHTSRELEQAKYKLNICKEVLGKHFIAFDPTTMEVHEFVDRLRITLPDFSTMVLKPTKLTIHSAQGADIGYHLRLETPNGLSCMYLSQQALSSMSKVSAENYLLHVIGSDLVRHAVNMSRGREVRN